ncbi:hypothetical protein C9382_27665 [Pseudomonas aylmerensis]|uniref:Uncharacterized protein n=1 Tax=Pseudomonas aylmerensis TaxID=1869229 RepID=A0A2T4FN76_9PSED|nr:hypothetical protein [Pseudomonas aylmerensis]OCW24890.1 hypothetical protein BBG20_17600 [Pseudomonas aylmerensis]PTC24808.1 hypothetical protein C9382_27665 [Pseudomonas aylmerensis]
MPEPGMDLGDVPAWFALIISIWTAYAQKKANSRAEELRVAAESKAEGLRLAAEAKASSDREKDQRRQRVEQIHRDIEELTALAIDYWMKPGSETGTSGVVINTKIKDISSRFSRYSAVLWPRASSDFLSFKQAVTGGEFQSHRRESSAPRSATIIAISTASGSLKHKLGQELDKLDIP